MNHNLYAVIRESCLSRPEAIAITQPEPGTASFTFRELDQATAMLANTLQFLQLPSGSRVAVQTDKSVETLMLYLAVLRAGMVYVPLHTGYSLAETKFFLEDARPDVLVCPAEKFGALSKQAFKQGVRHVFTLNPDRSGTLLQRAAMQSQVHEPHPCHPDDLAAIVYTSGTTGRSKGAMLSHGNLLSNAQTLQSYWCWRKEDVLLHALPLFHVHGLFVACHAALLGGSRMIWLPQFDPRQVLRYLPEATVFMGVPTFYTRLLEQAGLHAEGCRHMRLFISGSAPLRPDTHQAFEARTGHRILERYGMSETLMLTSNPCHPGAGPRRAGTVGLPLPGVEVRLTSKNKPVGPGEAGEVEVRGPNVFQGYWQLPDKTRESFTQDGWFITGDIACFDEQGYLTLAGRSKDLIITGGINVAPAEVEAALNELPGVAESAVIAAPHPDFGEAVVAVVVPHEEASTPDTEAWLRILKHRLAYFKMPKKIIVQSQLPRNTMGKVQKNRLRQQFAHLFSEGFDEFGQLKS